MTAAAVLHEAAVVGPQARFDVRALAKAAALAAILLLVLWYRRPDQFLHPYMWVEDAVSIRDYLKHGWASLWHPIAGYISAPIRLVHLLAETLSFRWLPETSLWLTIAFTYGIVAAVAFSPTRLKAPFACAVAVLLIPTDAEVFAVALYVGWWGTLLAMLALLWNDEGRRERLRLAFIVFGGLSTPVIVGLVPLFALRAGFLRTRREAIAAGVAGGVAAVQLAVMFSLPTNPVGATLGFDAWVLVEKFFGYFIVWSPVFAQTGAIPYVGLAALLFLGTVWYVHRRELGWPFALLAATFAVSIALSISRVSLLAIHPVLAGPRYFFYPYILLCWMLIQTMHLRGDVARIGAAFVLAFGFRNLLEFGQRRHDTLDWRANVDACVRSELIWFPMPIHHAGDRNNHRYLSISPAECRGLVERSLYDNEVVK